MSAAKSSCAQCRAKHKKCDLKDGVFPCTRCVNNGRECTLVPQDIPGRATKRKKTTVSLPALIPPIPAQSNANSFFSILADTWVIAAMAKLGPSHFGLQCAMEGIFTHAFQVGSVALVQKAAGLVSHFGLNLHNLTGILTNENKMTIKATYETFSDTAMQHHDAAVGREYKKWSTTSIGTRMLTMSNGIRSTNPKIIFSSHFREIFGDNILNIIARDRTPFYSLAVHMTNAQGLQRLVKAYMSLIERHVTSTSGPFTVSVPDIMLNTITGIHRVNIFLTLWMTQNGGKNHTIIEIVEDMHGKTSHKDTCTDEASAEDMSAAHSLVQLM